MRSSCQFLSNFIHCSNMSDIRKDYETNFDGLAYAKTYLGEEDYEHKFLVEEFYHRVFSKGIVSGKTLIDVGCGPSMRSALSGSKVVNDIYPADFVENSRTLVENWLRNGPNAFDFTNEFKHVANLEGESDIKYLEDRVRKSIKEVLFCDVLADNPLSPRPLQQFDIVTSSYCLDCFSDFDDYLKGCRGLVTLIRPGGYLLLLGTIDCTYYAVGDKKLPGNNIDTATATKALREAGLKILEVEEHPYDAPLTVDCDNKGVFTLIAQKI